ncbi:MAG: hypothetical protein P4L74_03065 [Candidatus Doudnabacteria bacterium]|nr:hypothetical protein [Candidatus Doudnabacteria bacterium]
MPTPPELQKEMERQSRIETRGGLTSESIKPVADVTLQHIQHFYKKPGAAEPEKFNKIMAGDVAGALESRMSQEQVTAITAKFTEAQLRQFNGIVEMSKRMFREKLGLNGYKGNGESFWEVSNAELPSANYAKTIVGANSEQAKVQFKEYATFVPTADEPNELLSEAIKFYDALLRAYARVQELAKSQNVDIKMKFADDLKVLLGNTDSAVVYVPNPETGKAVQAIIKDEMEKRGVKLGARKGRSSSGFDMVVNGTEISHRQLTGRAIAKVMTADYVGSRKLANYDSKKLAESIIERSEQVGRLTPEQMLKVI